MADDKSVHEPMSDNQETAEHSDETPVVPTEETSGVESAEPEAESEAIAEADHEDTSDDVQEELIAEAEAEATEDAGIDNDAEAVQEGMPAEEEDEEATAQPTEDDEIDESRRSSMSSSLSGSESRRASMRTEALIQAAARAVVAKINAQEAASEDFSILYGINEPQPLGDEDEAATAEHADVDGDVEFEQDGEVGEEEEDAVFSDRSQRTSLASFEHNSGASNNGEHDQQKSGDAPQAAAETEAEAEAEDAAGNEYEHDDDYHHEEHHRSSRGSGISHTSQYDRRRHDDEGRHHDGDDYVSHTIRGGSRQDFRSPSSVRNIQMTSPSPSAVFGVSPRSAARRRRVGTGEGIEDRRSMGSVGTYSSLPNSPSKQSTPTRLKVFRRPEPAPLVLLHATIMPTRWGWSDVLSGLDEMMARAPKKNGVANKSVHAGVGTGLASFEPSAALRRLHSAWCQLQEYSLGADTVTERGVLLPHPQNDYEVLEERLLEALELPVRRRARILECGHYLGPADADDDEDDEDGYGDEDGHDDANSFSKQHWCLECRSEIRYESLGAERVFRVKVYASNGLMTVGAWDACWREMERVDVEIEPIVADLALQRELNLLRTLQQQEAYRREREEEIRLAMYEQEEAEAEAEQEEEEAAYNDQAEEHEHDIHGADSHFDAASPSQPATSPPPATAPTDHSPPEADHEQWEADERTRESFGNTPRESLPPQTEPEPTAHATTHDANYDEAYSQYDSPSAQAYERREEKRHRQSSTPGPMDGGSSEYGGPAPAFPPQPAAQNGYPQNPQHPQNPYEAASLGELLTAAVRVFVRDRKHIVITLLSIVVIVLATYRGKEAIGPDPNAAVHQPLVFNAEPVSYDLAAAHVPAKMDALVETVVEKTTVKVYETVTQVATETSIEMSLETSLSMSMSMSTPVTTPVSTPMMPEIEAPPTTMTKELALVPSVSACPVTGDLFVVPAEPTSRAYEVLALSL